MTLADIPVDRPAHIESIGGPQAFVRRLISLGISPGSAVRVVRIAPLGDPLQVEVGRTQLSIRKNEARLITIA